METIPQTPFEKLPTELVFLILKYAAQPTFAQSEKYDAKNPYSTALKICLVSKAARSVALPEMLHTVLLDSRNMTAFVEALRIQKQYVREQHRLKFAYLPRIRNLWIGRDCRCPRDAPVSSSTTSEPESNLSLMAPVLLGAPSLAIDHSSMKLLTRSVKHVWKRMDKNVDHERSPPWRTKTLTLSGTGTGPWRIATHASGSAFLASITNLITLPDPKRDTNLHAMNRVISYIGYQDYLLPLCMSTVPWASFKNLESVSFAFPRVEFPFDRPAYNLAGLQLHTDLVTFPASIMKVNDVPKEIQASTETGRGIISLDDCTFVHVAKSGKRFGHADYRVKCILEENFTWKMLRNLTALPDRGAYANTSLATHKRAVLLVIDALRFDFIAEQPPEPA
ncbi:hypothetical protein EDB19DRAFT_2027614 [Suillus lakei]|nr:hypothetical protein EDB19DRAFT_2027614 [Suillus lakei]